MRVKSVSSLFFCLCLLLALPIEGVWADADSVFIFGRGADSVRLDPASITDNESINACNQIFETLVRFKKGTNELEPALATSWSTSEDKLTWTFKLRRNVAFHDGTPFNADSVIFTFMRQMDPKHPHAVAKGAYWKSHFSQVDKIWKTDDATINIKLKEPYAPFLYMLANNLVMIVSPTAFEAKGSEGFAFSPVGTGPFMFKEWKKNDRIVFDAFADYWGPKAGVDRVILRSIPDNTARIMALLAGEIDAMDGITPDTLKTLKKEKRKDLKVLAAPGLNTGFMAMNTQLPPFDNPSVRLAVAHAVNKKKLVREVYQGMATTATTLVPPVLWGFNDEVGDYAYDPEQSRKLLADAGFAGGIDTELWYMPVPRIYLPDCKLVAQAVQQDLEKVGIRVKLVTFDWGTYVEKIMKWEHPICFIGRTADYIDPDAFLHGPLISGGIFNFPQWKNSAYDALVEQARKELDPRKRTQLYRQAQNLVHQEAPLYPIAHGNNLVAVSKKVNGFYLHPTTLLWFDSITVNK